jgi:hypothetical protein
MEAYETALVAAVTEHPDEYGYPVSDVPKVVERMRAAIQRGSYNHDGYAFKSACKALGIKYTRSAIEAFITL